MCLRSWCWCEAPSLCLFGEVAELSVSGGCFVKLGPPGGPGLWTSEQLKNSDAKRRSWELCRSTGLFGRRSCVPRGRRSWLFFHRRTVRESGPERAPRGELGEVGAAGQRGRLSDRRAATESTTLPFCVVFESRASYNSRFAMTELGLLCL
jgi:hypothetical protein